MLLFSCDINVQLLHRRFAGRPKGLKVFLLFLLTGYHPSMFA